MRSSTPLQISTHDDLIHTDNPFSFSWSTGPSSPPFRHPQHPDTLPPTPPSEFEFDSVSLLQIKDDPPVSPKLVPSFATSGFWAGVAAVSSIDLLPDPISPTQKIAAPLSHPVTSTQQPSAPPSWPSVRQLLAEEMDGEHESEVDVDFFSAPCTPMRTPPRNSNPKQRPLSLQDESFVNRGAGRRKSNSANMLDRQAHDDDLVALRYRYQQVLQPSKSESNSQFTLWEKSEEEKGGLKKQGSKSCMKWAFKDLLRKTVPSSKAEAHYITKIMGASSSKSNKSNPNLSPQASPMHSSASLSTSQASQPSTPRRPSRHGSSTPAARSPLGHPPSPGRLSARQTLNRTPMSSPPQSPLSRHAIHYQQNKAQSLELTRKTFLPYRQSLLGCLGGPSAFPSEQQAW